MGEVNFYLKKPEDSTGKSLISLYKRYSGKRLVFSTGQTIDPKAWNPKKQRVKNNSATTTDGSQYLNDFLNGLSNHCEASYKKALSNGVPDPKILSMSLKNYVNKVDGLPRQERKGEFYKLIDRFITGEIKHKGKDKSPNTLQNYKTVKGHLILFEKVRKMPITFDSINLDFFYNYVSFLKSIKLAQNSIAKDITVLKVFMSEAIDLNYTTNIQYKHKKFTVEEEKTDSVYLTEKELLHLYKFDLSESKSLERAKDLFIFGSYVGLRFSDYSTVRPENIVKIENDFFIKIITKKTNELVIIPCNPIVMEIFKKYESSPNKLPNTISAQNFNKYVREAARLAGLTEKGRLSTDMNLELWECLSSHTARRSFATNLYLDGYPVQEIQKCTGHKSEKAFQLYIKVSKLDAAKRLNAHIKKGWSEKMLRVA